MTITPTSQWFCEDAVRERMGTRVQCLLFLPLPSGASAVLL